MTPAEEISMHQIPIPASEADVAKYAQIRLATLKTNPEAFSSTFAEASLFTPEQWKMRVETRGRTTFAACRIATNSESGADSRSDSTEWVGTLSLLHPDLLESAPIPVAKIPRVADAIASGQLIRYMIVGLWVHPSMRRKSVAKSLIQAALDLVSSEQRDSKRPSIDTMRTPKKMVLLVVHEGNHAAKALYASMGFKEETDCENIENGACAMTKIIQ